MRSAAALGLNFSFESRSGGLLKRLVNFSNSEDGTAVIRMQIHRQTQIIIIASAERERELYSLSARSVY